MNNLETRRKRLKFRAWRRGFREADLILGPFVDLYASDFDATQLDELEALLEFPDQDLYEWIVEKTVEPPEVTGEILRKIREFRDNVYVSLGEDHGG
ncbi:MAG: succinate dehydrogenase assembly factor 2 [Phenylobacterium zucineum]|nr:MAG: succinate dehydrogenase assembly factor 2 [Phenylobacterium zucineum]